MSSENENVIPPSPAPAPPHSVDWAQKIAMVSEARLLFGASRARSLWAMLGFPSLPLQPVDFGDDDPYLALNHLLWGVMLDDGHTLGEVLREAFTRSEVRLQPELGVRFLHRFGREGFALSPNCPAIAALIKGTLWEDCLIRTLARLPDCDIVVTKLA